MKFPVDIIDSLVTLMYEQEVTIKKSDYKAFMEAAKSLQVDGLIVNGDSKAELPGTQKK